MSFDTYAGSTPLPNIHHAIRPGDGDAGRVIFAARHNVELDAALRSIEGFEECERRTADLVEAHEHWRTQLPSVDDDAQTALLEALDAGKAKEMPSVLAKARAEHDAVVQAMVVSTQTASKLVSDQCNRVRGGAERALAILDGRVREVVAALRDNTARNIPNAETAIARECVDEWQAANGLRDDVRQIHAAQSVIMRAFFPELEELRQDPQRVILLEVDDWQAIDERLPQIVRHGGIWRSDKHKGKSEDLLERWQVPWPAEPDQRVDWLIENHPDAVVVPSAEKVRAAATELQRRAARRTPTGEETEPQSMFDVPLNRRARSLR